MATLYKNNAAILSRAEQQPTAPNQDKIFECADCGNPIYDTKIGGKVYCAGAIASNAQKKYGRMLCINCSQKQAAQYEMKG